MRSSSLRLLFPALFLCAMAGLLAGCAGEPRASVSGKVTLQGMPLKNKAVLTFIGPDHVPLNTETDESGAYSLAGLPIGETRVTIVSIPEGGPTSRSLNSVQDKSSLRGRLGYSLAPPTEVPLEYGNAADPVLKFNLVEGNNELPIDLVSPATARRNQVIVR